MKHVYLDPWSDDLFLDQVLRSSKVALEVLRLSTMNNTASHFENCTCPHQQRISVGTAQADDWAHTRIAQSKEVADEKFVCPQRLCHLDERGEK
jgi:hypothetical protein